jgi:hypothetical protein
MRRDLYLLPVMLLFLANAVAQEGDWSPKAIKPFPVEHKELPQWLWEEMLSDPLVKEHFGFKLAFCQHPMYLLIDEDRGEPPVGERIPPWGAPTSPEYVERVKRNLGSLEKYPEIKLNYQWSAYELNHMLEAFPEVQRKMEQLYEAGSLDFLDGTYSQAHLHVLGSESNWRQFEYGLEIYMERFGKEVDIYARQETGLHKQLPQLLNQFGYRYMTLPSFHSIVEFNGGTLEIMNNDGIYLPLSGQEFIVSEGLDGSQIPAYLWLTPGEWVDQTDQFEMDLYSGPKIFYEFPDLEEVDRGIYDEYKSIYDWVLLGDALDERYKEAPPTASASIYSYWSYLEGVWAEELMRNNKLAEEAAILAEQVQAMGFIGSAGVDRSADIRSIWKEILKSQHHDISWIEVTDLRRKSISRLHAARQCAEEIMEEIASGLLKKDPTSVAVINGLPHPRESMITLSGKKSLEGISMQEYKGELTGWVALPAGGFISFKEKGKPASSLPGELPDSIVSDEFRVRLDNKGLIHQIMVNGKELLTCEDYLGGELRARIDKTWYNNRIAEVKYLSGPVFDLVERKGTLGHIPVVERYYYFKHKPVIKVELDFEFHGDEVGNMWMDETKINVYFPTLGEVVHHDLPFGYTEARQGRPLFATNWVSCGGIVYVNRGTIKHRVGNGVIANVLAWGSNYYSNRLHWDYWTSQAQHDIRLYGNHTLEYYIIPVESFDGNLITREVADLVSPIYVTRGGGEHSYYESGNDFLMPTAVFEDNGKIRMRGYKLPGEDQSGYRDWEIFNKILKEH